ncbi:hypothetical protein NX801_08860 [Streptomyces sp. LP05-1]|uniref:Uncharacterized protein n=1 Tax=Streptomyces pyxinae TaxID=2970734 RepID=A0ABT2CEE1_9ACTN|nr:hypothetical protein [Streptomyces sp. LP05-1]MCS0635772.1 hypothetical protein [Streptomyces sp. LP05-1]
MSRRRDSAGDRLADMVGGFDKGLRRGLRGKKRKRSKTKKRQRRNERQIAALSDQVSALTGAVASLTNHVGGRPAARAGDH